MEDRFFIRIKTSCFIESCKNQLIVVAVAYLVCNNASVKQVKNCKKIELFYLGPDIILEFRNVGEPLFKWNGCMERLL